MRTTTITCALLLLLWPTTCAAADAAAPDFAKDVAPIFAKYCAGCHNGDDREGELSLESFAELQKGGEHGAVVVPGRADASLLIRALTGEVEPAMPPEDNPRPTEAEIEVLRAWIDAGAAGPEGAEMPLPELTTPEIAAAAGVRPYLTSLALSPDGKRLALGSYRHVELVDPANEEVAGDEQRARRQSEQHFVFAGRHVVRCQFGRPRLVRRGHDLQRDRWRQTVIANQGHRDALYDAELSPDGQLLATCSYDRQINLWDVASGKLVRTLTGHNGAVFELAFSPDGSLLASASADETVKIWSVATGERLDTLGQPEGEQCAVAISPDATSIVAGGGDRQVRMWRLVSRDKPEINPLKFASTAHDSPIVKLAFSPDGSKLVTASEGRELVLWDCGDAHADQRFDEAAGRRHRHRVRAGRRRVLRRPHRRLVAAVCDCRRWMPIELPRKTTRMPLLQRRQPQ